MPKITSSIIVTAQYTPKFHNMSEYIMNIQSNISKKY